MYSTKNSLKTFVSPFIGSTAAASVGTLPEGEIGFFSATTGLIIAGGIGTGYIAQMKNGEILKSKVFAFAGFVAETKDYTTPALRTSTLTVATAVTGKTYQITVESKIPGMRGEFFHHGTHVAAAADTTTIIAAALAASLNASLTREGKTEYLTVTSAVAIITIVSKLPTYIQGKKLGKQTDYTSRLNLPIEDAVLETVTVTGNDGIGYGPWVVEREHFAQGDSDSHRELEWRNNFEFAGLATAAGEYDVIVLTVANEVDTANSKVSAPMEYILAFNSAGTTPIPIIDAAVNGDTTVTGVAYPGSSVILSVDGAPESAVTAHATTGVFTVTVTVATGEVLTATAQSGASPISAVSTAVVVTAT